MNQADVYGYTSDPVFDRLLLRYASSIRYFRATESVARRGLWLLFVMWNDAIETLAGEFGLTSETVYLLPLIPLIEVMWADGVTQRAEVSIFYECLTRHLADLYSLADGEEVVSIADAEKFAADLLNTRPDPEKLRRLRDLSVQMLNHSPDEKLRRSVLDSCLDLAAIAVTRYPYERRDRVMSAEKRVLHELFNRLRVSSE